MDDIVIITLGISGIVVNLLLLVLMIIFKVKDVKENRLFGYRTEFSMSSKEAWAWANKVCVLSYFIGCPILLGIHIALFVLTFINKWNYWFMFLTMISPAILLIAICPFIEIIGRKKFKNK